ncbi:unnamed protein product, partial [Medioppia subpectinata]
TYIIKFDNKSNYDYMYKLFGELRCLVQIPPEYVVQYYNSWFEHKFLYIQLEYCSHTLKDIIALKGPEFGRLSPVEPMNAIEYFISSEIFKEVLECVQYLHDLTESSDVLLRDLRADNILVADHGRDGRYIKLSNFGSVRADDADVHSVGAIGQELFDLNIHDVNALQKYSSHELRDNFGKLFKLQFVSYMKLQKA